jgi:hypothetical protein
MSSPTCCALASSGIKVVVALPNEQLSHAKTGPTGACSTPQAARGATREAGQCTGQHARRSRDDARAGHKAEQQQGRKAERQAREAAGAAARDDEEGESYRKVTG